MSKETPHRNSLGDEISCEQALSDMKVACGQLHIELERVGKELQAANERADAETVKRRELQAEHEQAVIDLAQANERAAAADSIISVQHTNLIAAESRLSAALGQVGELRERAQALVDRCRHVAGPHITKGHDYEDMVKALESSTPATASHPTRYS